MKRKLIPILSGLVLLLAAALAVGACTGSEEEEARQRAAPPAEEAAPAPAEPAPAATDAGGSGRDAVAEEELVGALAELPPVDQRVIQTASLSITVPRGEFEETIDRARTIAAGFGGFVTASTASQGANERLVRGTIVLRVPDRSYAQAMSELTKLGRVKAREESGQDVSREYVDLEARERHLEAVERQLLSFLEKTATVAQALAVQDRLNDVQLQLEEIRGQLRYLDDQTSFATISLAVAERGVPVAAGEGGGWGIADAWATAATGFLKVIGGVFVGLATAGPIIAAIALAFFAGRLVLRRRRAAKPGAGETGSAVT